LKKELCKTEINKRREKEKERNAKMGENIIDEGT
jgi:hypothetical protein